MTFYTTLAPNDLPSFTRERVYKRKLFPYNFLNVLGMDCEVIVNITLDMHEAVFLDYLIIKTFS